MRRAWSFYLIKSAQVHTSEMVVDVVEPVDVVWKLQMKEKRWEIAFMVVVDSHSFSAIGPRSHVLEPLKPNKLHPSPSHNFFWHKLETVFLLWLCFSPDEVQEEIAVAAWRL